MCERVLNQATAGDLSFGVLQFGREYRWHRYPCKQAAPRGFFRTLWRAMRQLFPRSYGRDFCGVRIGVNYFRSAIVARWSVPLDDCTAAGIRSDDDIFFGDVFFERATGAIGGIENRHE